MEDVGLSAPKAPAGEEFPVGSYERPDPAGVVRRGEAARFSSYAREHGPMPCWAGRGLGGARCPHDATMEVYGKAMCAVHGEEAASGAMEEIAYDLENELQRPVNPYVRPVSPHIEHALRHGFDAIPAATDDYQRDNALLLAAYPLDRDRADAETVLYAEDPDGNGRGEYEPPYDQFMGDRMLIHRHMRLAFEAGADWLVEVLEAERQQVAAQVAYALALEKSAGLRP